MKKQYLKEAIKAVLLGEAIGDNYETLRSVERVFYSNESNKAFSFISDFLRNCKIKENDDFFAIKDGFLKIHAKSIKQCLALAFDKPTPAKYRFFNLSDTKDKYANGYDKCLIISVDIKGEKDIKIWCAQFEFKDSEPAEIFKFLTHLGRGFNVSRGSDIVSVDFK